MIYDFHAHLCFGVDDGPSLQSDVFQLIDLAVASGTTHICVTPHVIDRVQVPAWEKILAQVEQCRDYISKCGYSLEIYPGAEVYLNPELLPLLGVGGSYCINGGHYILVELPLKQFPNYAENFWYDLRLKGLRPIIAHPERYGILMHNLEILRKWRTEGLICQCNVGSYAGQYGPRAKDAAEELTRQGLVDLVGSDAHLPDTRNTDMRSGLAVLQNIVSTEDYLRIIQFNPEAILCDKILQLPPLQIAEQKPKIPKFLSIFGIR